MFLARNRAANVAHFRSWLRNIQRCNRLKMHAHFGRFCARGDTSWIIFDSHEGVCKHHSQHSPTQAVPVSWRHRHGGAGARKSCRRTATPTTSAYGTSRKKRAGGHAASRSTKKPEDSVLRLICNNVPTLPTHSHFRVISSTAFITIGLCSFMMAKYSLMSHRSRATRAFNCTRR